MDMPTLDKNITCCFAGYRPHKFTYPSDQKSAFFTQLKKDIKKAVSQSYSDGYRVFLCGGAIGFDLMCGECVVELKKKYPDIKLGCILPFEKQSKSFSSGWQRRYTNVLENCDFINYSSLEYVHGCYSERSEKMINSSKRIITYFDGRGGGTARVMAAAQFNKLEIVNLSKDAPIPENITFFTGRKRKQEQVPSTPITEDAEIQVETAKEDNSNK